MEDVSAAQGQESQPTVLLVVSVNGHESALPLSTFECRDVTSGWRDYVGGILASLKGILCAILQFSSHQSCRGQNDAIVLQHDDEMGLPGGESHCGGG